jgi:capsular polysaccharide export protein
MAAHAERTGAASSLIWWLPGQIILQPGIAAKAGAVIRGECDPWHLFAQSGALWVDEVDELAVLGAIAGIPVLQFGEHEAVDEAAGSDLLQAAKRRVFDEFDYFDPFDGGPVDPHSSIALLKYWRELIDANRSIAGAFGFAHWKKGAVQPLLWGGSEPVRFLPATTAALQSIPAARTFAIWKARVPEDFLTEVEAQRARLYEVEDGFIRSAGLGADCVPPLSIVVDRLGVHYDPAKPSELEALLEKGDFAPDILERAERLRRLVIDTGVSKYGVGGDAMVRPGGERRHILVTGQVEDDRSVRFGGGDVAGNLELLRRARAQEPDAFVLYKPHPDVEAGHRKGIVADEQALAYADTIVRDVPISALLDMVDGVHVLTSLAGFEALIRGKQVTTHGVPFYAGWGLTTDLGEIPGRRTARRDVIEMVAAVLMLYPRYLDPVTALPCPPEILVRRLIAGVRRENRVIVSLRRLQGRVRQKLSRVRRWI